MSDEKSKTFDVVICSKQSGEVFAIVAATVETKQARALVENCEARLVTTGKYKVGDTLSAKGETT